MSPALDREQWWEWDRVSGMSPDDRETRRVVEHEQAIEARRHIQTSVTLLHVHDERTADEQLRLGRLLRASMRRVRDTETLDAWLAAKRAGRL